MVAAGWLRTHLAGVDLPRPRNPHVILMLANSRELIDHLDQAILSKAFRDELVPQDPADEPASILLDRIRAERSATANPAIGVSRVADRPWRG
jgi:hypothetical protein